MVSTRRSGSLSGNNTKRSSSSEDKPSSPKRQKVGNGGTSEKLTPAAENSKEMCTSSTAADPGECGSADAPTTGVDAGDVMNSGKGDAAPAVAVSAPIGLHPLRWPEKPSSSFSSWSIYQKQNPWCRLLSQYAQNPNISLSIPNFTFGSSKTSSFHLKDQSLGPTLCKIKHSQCEGNVVAVLESTGSKGSIQVNGIAVKKNTSCVLNSGDEVVFGSTGNYAYIFQQVNTVAVKGAEIQSGVGKYLPLERRKGDPSAVTGASILASLSLRQDLSRWKSPSQTTSKIHKANDVPTHSVLRDGTEVELDGQESSSIPNTGSDKAADIGAKDRSSPIECDLHAGTEAGNVKLSGVLDERNGMRGSQPASTLGMSLRCAMFKEDIRAGILDGKEIDVSFDNFPYYISENTKKVLTAASYIQLKHKEHAKYTSELTTVNPRILLSGPAGSEIYQEMLAKALANHFGAKLLIFDSHSFLGGLSTKEAELLKGGFNPEKSCTCTKESPLPTELFKSMDPSASEADTPSSSNAPTSYDDEPQPKLEADTIPSSSRDN
ncbi:AAA-type ATPase family protein [Quillaja saponaria]|uniref:AAA-type ATPase family protein n=1 Tax=Quillaja saponaria TaxID=32244 RepID=A0AAD7P889_QUISA|nr:AAA-type ATPase family protein [Quillaja saponaria]